MRLSSLLAAFGCVALLGLASAPNEAAAAPRDRGPQPRNTSSLAKSDVTIYGATWCSACRALESGLRARNVPFEVVDVDKSPQAFERARAAAGAGSAIPLTGVLRGTDTTWIVGADVDGVERLYRGN